MLVCCFSFVGFKLRVSCLECLVIASGVLFILLRLGVGGLVFCL